MSAYDLVKINQSQSNQNASISSNSVHNSVTYKYMYDPVQSTLLESEAEAEEPTNQNT